MKCVLAIVVGFILCQPVSESARASEAKPDQVRPMMSPGPDVQSSSYVTSLRSRFESSIVYKTDKAAEIVKGFNIDCKRADGRYIPLENILLVGISQLQSKKNHVTDFVQEAGGEVQITQALADNTGRLITRPDVAFEINKWGELIPVGVSPKAVSVACIGMFGPIWSLPSHKTEDDGARVDPEMDPSAQSQANVFQPENEQSSSPANPWTRAKQCEFFKLAAFSMINFRDQGRPQSYGIKMVAFQLANYRTIGNRKVGVTSGLEAETRLNLTGDIARMAHDIWTVKNTRGELIPSSLIIDYAGNSCAWPAFDW